MNRDQLELFPRTVRDYVQDDHDASFLVDPVNNSVLRAFELACAGRGTEASAIDDAVAAALRLCEGGFVESQA